VPRQSDPHAPDRAHTEKRADQPWRIATLPVASNARNRVAMAYASRQSLRLARSQTIEENIAHFCGQRFALPFICTPRSLASLW